jgi:beta-lactamase regulating signal transducer with metallopeptidase domain
VKALIETLGMMAAQGTLLALLALVLTRAGRLRPAWQAAIWLVVLIKLAIPWGPALPWSLSDLVAMFTAHGAPPPSPLPLALEGPAPVVHPSPLWTVLAAIWALGAAIVVARAVITHVRAVRRVRRASLVDVVDGVRVVLGTPDEGPHVVGVLRSTIVVPPGLTGDMLRAALLHELAHVRRRDGLARVIQVWAAAVMWWFPVARLVSRRLDLAREAACDAAALEQGIERPAYARLLVEMATRRAPVPALAVPRALDARIAAVLATAPTRARYGALHKLALAAWAVLALGGARTAAAHGRATCTYTPRLAQALYVSYPEYDLDGDGTLSRDEACDLQAELRTLKIELSSPLDPDSETLLSEPLCCKWDQGGAYSTFEENASCLNE